MMLLGMYWILKLRVYSFWSLVYFVYSLANIFSLDEGKEISVPIITRVYGGGAWGGSFLQNWKKYFLLYETFVCHHIVHNNYDCFSCLDIFILSPTCSQIAFLTFMAWDFVGALMPQCAALCVKGLFHSELFSLQILRHTWHFPPISFALNWFNFSCLFRISPA